MALIAKGVGFIFLFTFSISRCHTSCPRGYYGSPCQPCPTSTYKDFSGAAASCKLCPANSGHQLRGSVTLHDCKCLEGYSGQPEHGIPCQIRNCLPLNPPRNGHIVGGSCHSTYSSVCIMRCDEGYKGEGSAERQCIVSNDDHMTWTGSPWNCRVIQCPLLFVSNADPPYGSCSPAFVSNPVHKTSCSFQCRPSYELKGSEVRICQQDETWSGTPTSCEIKTCPKLPPVLGAEVVPSVCLTGPMRVYEMCQYRCARGYLVDKVSWTVIKILECKTDKTWSAPVPKCQDSEPPVFVKCPSPLTISTAKGKATAKVLWSVEVTDNSLSVDPQAKIMVRSSHLPSQELPIGSNTIEVNATDNAGNVAFCAFSVRIVDTEPPTCGFCPADIVQEETNPTARVYWNRPVCSDNSGKPVTIDANIHSGAIFSVPSTFQVRYNVRDGASNENTKCSFKITLKVKTCSRSPLPRNGALACVTLGASDACAVMCGTGTDYEYNPALVYFCSGGQWMHYSGPFPSHPTNTLWPSCSSTASPSFINRDTFPNYFFVGDANDPNVQASIKTQFLALLKSPFIPPPFCQTHKECTIDNISVYTGAKG